MLVTKCVCVRVCVCVKERERQVYVVAFARPPEEGASQVWYLSPFGKLSPKIFIPNKKLKKSLIIMLLNTNKTKKSDVVYFLIIN